MALSFCIFNIIIFRLDYIQPHCLVVIPNALMLIFVYRGLLFIISSFHHGCRHFIYYFWGVQTWFQSCAPGISLKIRFFPVWPGSAREKYVMGQPQFFDIEYQRSYRLFLLRKMQVDKNKKCLHRITLKSQN